ncbi:PIN domain-containing protein [soil metagenome]
MNEGSPRQFVDTNVLIYAHDTTAGEKRLRSRDVLEELWESGEGCVSVQVLQEFFVNVTRKIPNKLDAGTAASILESLSAWRVHEPRTSDVFAAVAIHQRTGISFWDAMIVYSASSMGCGVLWSEDLNAGQSYEGVEVRTPFTGT